MNEQELAKVRGEIVKKLMAITGTSILLGGEVGKFNTFADQILNTPIKIERVCKYCEGTGLIGGSGINDRCDDCNGTGIQPIEFTLMGLVEKELK